MSAGKRAHHKPAEFVSNKKLFFVPFLEQAEDVPTQPAGAQPKSGIAKLLPLDGTRRIAATRTQVGKR
jgi:hypothetical protein